MAEQIRDYSTGGTISNRGQVGSGADYRKKPRKQGLAESNSSYAAYVKKFNEENTASEAAAQRKALSDMAPKAQ